MRYDITDRNIDAYEAASRDYATFVTFPSPWTCFSLGAPTQQVPITRCRPDLPPTRLVASGRACSYADAVLPQRSTAARLAALTG
jgi:hypothetical protein